MYSAWEDGDFSPHLPWKTALHTKLELWLRDCKDTGVDVNCSVRQAAFVKGSMLPGVAAERKCAYGRVSTCSVQIGEMFRGA